MRLLPSIELATQLTRAGKIGEALAALTGRAPGAEAAGPKTERLPSMRAMLGEAHAALRPGTLSALEDTREAPPPVPDGASFEDHRPTGAAGLGYKLYVPARAGSGPLPLVVMLHGCTQSPDDFATGTRMNALAEAEGFYVAYPAQSRAANAQKCWNWFRAADQGRSGEPALVVAMVREIMRAHTVDPSRVYVAGLSAGGAAAAVLGQNYPEVFAAVGVHSGLACGAAADVPSAFAAMKRGSVTSVRGTAVPTVVFHGDRDATVDPINGAQVALQARSAERLTEQVETATAPGGRRYTRTTQADASGRPMAEHWVLHGAGHAWSGGDPSGSYTDPRGPDASAAMLHFFRHHSLDGVEAAAGEGRPTPGGSPTGRYSGYAPGTFWS